MRGNWPPVLCPPLVSACPGAADCLAASVVKQSARTAARCLSSQYFTIQWSAILYLLSAPFSHILRSIMDDGDKRVRVRVLKR